MKIFVWWVLLGVMACVCVWGGGEGDSTPWGCDPRMGGELATMLFILLQLIQVLTPGSNLINFYEDQKEVGVGTSISHK